MTILVYGEKTSRTHGNQMLHTKASEECREYAFFRTFNPKASIRPFSQPTSVGFFSSRQEYRTRCWSANKS